MYRPFAQPLAKFFADRGTHLAAMIAYFGLLSSVSLIFLALAVLGWTGRAEESSYFVKALDHLFPSQSIENIVKVVQEIRENATALGVIGGAFLLWTSLSLFSVLESAFNIVYDRPNRSFLHGKYLATLFMAGSIVVLATGLVIGGFGYDLLQRFAGGVIANGVVAYALSALVSTLSVFVFLVIAYERLTNAALTLREVWPGAALAAVLLQLTFQILPLFVRLSREVVALQALGTSALLLVWIYLMANVIVFGAEVNWWYGHRDEEEVAGLGLERRRRAGAMGVCALPGVAELGDRARLAERHEDRVVAEALVAAALRRDRPLQGPGAAPLLLAGAERDELADVAGAAIVAAGELLEQPRDAVGGPAGGCDPRAATEGGHLDSGVLAEHPLLGPGCLPPERGLRAGVLVVRRAILGRVLAVGFEQLELPARQGGPQLLELVPVPRREPGARHSATVAERTPSSATRPSRSSPRLASAAVLMTTSSRRASSSSPISSDSIT